MSTVTTYGFKRGFDFKLDKSYPVQPVPHMLNYEYDLVAFSVRLNLFTFIGFVQ
jgi:hypothetical protein